MDLVDTGEPSGCRRHDPGADLCGYFLTGMGFAKLHAALF